MPPKLVRLCTRVRNDGALLAVVASLMLAFVVSSPMYAEVARFRAGTATSQTRIYLSATLPQGRTGVAYNGGLSVRGGSAPYAFETIGSLPPGIVLNSSTGVFSGTPTTAGTFYFAASVTDSQGNTGDKKLAIAIAPTTQVSVQISPTLSTLASGGTQQFSATVSGSNNTAVTWSTTAGTISSSGLLTAPTVSTRALTPRLPLLSP
jgi:hypothetical protein